MIRIRTVASFMILLFFCGGLIINEISAVIDPIFKTSDSLKVSLKNGLVGYFPFDGDAQDRSGNGNHGIISGPVLASTDRVGRQHAAYQFGSINTSFSYIDLPGQQFDFTADLSIAFWIKADWVSAIFPTVIIDKSFFRSVIPGQILPFGSYMILGPNPFRFRFVPNSGTQQVIPPNSGISSFYWTHFAVVIESSSCKLYLNGSIVFEQGSCVENIKSTDSMPLRIGGSISSNNLRRLQGHLDDLLFYNRALTSSEVSFVANLNPEELEFLHFSFSNNVSSGMVAYFAFDGNIFDKSGRRCYSSSWTALTFVDDRFGHKKNSVYLNNSFVVIGNPFTAEDENISIAMWIKPESKNHYSLLMDFSYILKVNWYLMQLPPSYVTFNYFDVNQHPAFNFTTNVQVAKAVLLTANVWNHLVLVKNHSQIIFYVNGTMRSSFSILGNSSKIFYDGRSLTLGARYNQSAPVNNYDAFFQGSIDDLYFYNRALTENEAMNLFSDRIIEGGDQSSLRYQLSSRFHEKLLAYYPFDGTANDYSGRHDNMRIFGQIISGLNRFSQPYGAFYFNGGMKIEVNGAFVDFNQSMTFAFWMKSSLASPSGIFELSFFSPSSGSPAVFQILGPGRFYYGFQNDNDFIYDMFQVQAPISTLSWSHVVIVKNRLDLSLYINGFLYHSATSDWGDTFLTFSPGPLTFNIGQVSGSNNNFEGFLDDLFIFNRALSGEEIQLLHTLNFELLPGFKSPLHPHLTINLRAYFPLNGNLDEKGGNNLIAKSYGTVQYVEDQFGNPDSAYYFDGMTSYITVDNLYYPADLSEMALSFWMKPLFKSGTSTIMDSGFEMSGWIVMLLMNSTLLYDCTNQSNLPIFAYPPQLEVDEAATFQWGKWTHVVINKDENLKFYINGKLNVAIPLSEDITFVDNSFPFVFGAKSTRSQYENFYQGALDEIFIYDRVLSTDEITNLYLNHIYQGFVFAPTHFPTSTPTFLPTSSPTISPEITIYQGIIALYPFDGSDNVAIDVSGYGNDGRVQQITHTRNRFHQPDSAFFFQHPLDSVIISVQHLMFLSSFTFSFWIRVPVQGNSSRIFTVITNDGSGQIIYLELFARPILRLHVQNDIGDNTQVLGSNCNLTSSWNHFAFVMDDSIRGTFYINGLACAISSISLSNFQGISSPFSLILGNNSILPSEAFIGAIDDLFIHNRALSSQEIVYLSSINIREMTGFYRILKPNFENGLQLYLPFTNALPDDLSMSLSLISGLSLQFNSDRFGIPNNAATFKGSEFMSIQNFASSLSYSYVTEMSISFWFKPSPTMENTVEFLVGSSSIDIPFGWYIVIIYGVNSSALYYNDINPNSIVETVFPYSPDSLSMPPPDQALYLNLSSWNHIVVTQNNSFLSLYLNGELAIKLPFQYQIFFDWNVTSKLWIGETSAGEFQLHGELDDLFMFSRVLSGEEVGALYRNDIYSAPPPIETDFPTFPPVAPPSQGPSRFPTILPSELPTRIPSAIPAPTASTLLPSVGNPTSAAPFIPPIINPTFAPVLSTTNPTSLSPVISPTIIPSTASPSTLNPAISPSTAPDSSAPTFSPSSLSPTISPTVPPSTIMPSTMEPSLSTTPSFSPTFTPSLVENISTTTTPSSIPSIICTPYELPTSAPSSFTPEFLKNELLLFLPFTQSLTDISGIQIISRFGESLPIFLPDRFNRRNSSLYFNGVNSFLQVLDSSLNLQANFTIAFWLMPLVQDSGYRGSDSIQIIFDKVQHVGNQSFGGWYCYRQNNTISFNFLNELNKPEFDPSSLPQFFINENQWNFIVISKNGNEFKFYHDGKLIFNQTSSGKPIFNTQNLFIGARRTGRRSFSHYFYGNFDDLMIFNKSIELDEILHLYGYQMPTSFPSAIPSPTPTSSTSSAPPQIMATLNPVSFPSDASAAPTPYSTLLQYPTSSPSPLPSSLPSFVSFPTSFPSQRSIPMSLKSSYPSSLPSIVPAPTNNPSIRNCPSLFPFYIPSSYPSIFVVQSPTFLPTTSSPTRLPSTLLPTFIPSSQPTSYPSSVPSRFPIYHPSGQPTTQPIAYPTSKPTFTTKIPTVVPSIIPTRSPSVSPTRSPSEAPTNHISVSSLIISVNSSRTDVLVTFKPTNSIAIFAGIFQKANFPTTLKNILDQQKKLVLRLSAINTLSFSNLIPLMDYSIYFYVQSSNYNTTLSEILQSRRNISTSCCREISFSSQLLKVLEGTDYLNFFSFTVNGLPKHSLQISYRFLNTKTNAIIASSTVPSSLSIPTISEGSTQLTSSSFISSLNRLAAGNYSVSLILSGVEAAFYQLSGPIQLQVISTNFPLPAPAFRSCIFSNDGLLLSISFDTSTNRGGYSIGQSFSCAKLLDFSCSNRSTCQWTSDTSISASIYPADECASPGNSIRLANTAIIKAKCPLTACSNATWPVTSLSSSMIISRPVSPVEPTIVLNIPPVLPSCASLVFDLSSSSGNSGRSWKNISVKIDNDQGSMTDTVQSLINAVYEKYPVVIDPPLIIGSSYFDENVNYLFTIRMCNFFGKCGIAMKSLTFVSTLVPSVTIIGPNLVTIKRLQPISLISNVENGCNGSTLHFDQIQFSWKVSRQSITNNSLVNENSIVSQSKDITRFSLPSFALQVNQIYFITLTTTYQQNSASASVQVIVQQGNIVANILGNANQLNMRPLELINLDASRSYDEDKQGLYGYAAGLSFSWSCIQIQPTINYSCNSIFELKSSISSPLLSLKAKESSAGVTVDLMVVVGDVKTTRSATTSATINILSPLSPVITLTSNAISNKINAGQSLKVAASISLPKSTDNVDVSGFVNWITLSPSLNLTQSSTTPLAQTFTTTNSFNSYLSLLPNSLKLESIYSFVLQCQLTNGMIVSNQISITINSPPSSGSFQMNPMIGTEATDSFNFKCSGWLDSDLPISYQFGYISPNSVVGVTKIIRTLSQLPTTSSVLPAGSSSNDDLLTCTADIYDSMNANSLSTISVTVQPSLFMNYSTLLAVNLYYKTTLSVDELAKGTSVVTSIINKVNCTNAPDCSTLHREECRMTSHTCGPCLSSYFSTFIGDGNDKCYNKIPTKISHQLKECPFNCSVHGQCHYYSVLNDLEVTTCHEGDLSCYSACVCDTGYQLSTYCDIPDSQMQTMIEIRDQVVNGIYSFVTKQDNSEQAVIGWMNSITDVSTIPQQISVKSASTLLSLTNYALNVVKNNDYSASSTLPNFLDAMDAISSTINTIQATNRRYLRKQRHRQLLENTEIRGIDILSSIQNYSEILLNDLVPGQLPNKLLKNNFRVHLENIIPSINEGSSSRRSRSLSTECNQMASVDLLQSSFEKALKQTQTSVDIPFCPVNSVLSSSSSLPLAVISVSSKLYSLDNAFTSNVLSLVMANSPCEDPFSPNCQGTFSMASNNQDAGIIQQSTNHTIHCASKEISSHQISCSGIPTNFTVACNGTEIEEIHTFRCPEISIGPTCAGLLGDQASTLGCSVVYQSPTNITCSCPLISPSPMNFRSRSRSRSRSLTISNDSSSSSSSSSYSVSYVTLLTTVEGDFIDTVVSAQSLSTTSIQSGWQALVTVGAIFATFLGAMYFSYRADKEAMSKVSTVDKLIHHAKLQSSVYQQKLAIQHRNTTTNHNNNHHHSDSIVESQIMIEIAEETLPQILSNQKFTKKIWNENKRFHKYLGIIYFFSLQFPRILRVISLFSNIIIMLFIQSLTYNFTHGNDGTCETLKTQSKCLSLKNTFGTSDSRCSWNTQTEKCAYITPENNIQIVLFIAMFSSFVSTPLAVIIDYLINYILAAPSTGTANRDDKQEEDEDLRKEMKKTMNNDRFTMILPSNLKNQPIDNHHGNPLNLLSTLRDSFLGKSKKRLTIGEFDIQVEKDYSKLVDNLLQYRSSLQDSQQKSEIDHLWALNENGQLLPCWNESKKLLSNQSIGFFSKIKNLFQSLLTSTVAQNQSISLSLKQEFTELYSQIDKEIHYFQLLSNNNEKMKNKRLLFLFQKDLLPGITGEILNTKNTRENSILSPVSIMMKMITWFSILMIDIGMLFYVFLFASNQEYHQQTAWGRSLGLYFLLDILFISSFTVFFMHVLLPTIIMKDVKQIKMKVTESISNYYQTLADEEEEDNEKDVDDDDEDESDDDELESAPLHLAKAAPSSANNHHQMAKYEKKKKSKPKKFNAAEYLFLSYRLAQLFPNLKASKIILKFYSPWPKQSYQHTIDMKKDYSHSYYSAISRSASIIIIFFLANFLATPLAIQDMFLQITGALAFGYTILLHIQLYQIYPILVIIPSLSLIGGSYLLFQYIQSYEKNRSDVEAREGRALLFQAMNQKEQEKAEKLTMTTTKKQQDEEEEQQQQRQLPKKIPLNNNRIPEETTPGKKDKKNKLKVQVKPATMTDHSIAEEKDRDEIEQSNRANKKEKEKETKNKKKKKDKKEKEPANRRQSLQYAMQLTSQLKDALDDDSQSTASSEDHRHQKSKQKAEIKLVKAIEKNDNAKEDRGQSSSAQPLSVSSSSSMVVANKDKDKQKENGKVKTGKGTAKEEDNLGDEDDDEDDDFSFDEDEFDDLDFSDFNVSEDEDKDDLFDDELDGKADRGEDSRDSRENGSDDENYHHADGSSTSEDDSID